MADADEDRIPTLSQQNDPDNDSNQDEAEDQAPDFAVFLSSINNKTTKTTQQDADHLLTTATKSSSALPKRGTKSFEPNPTQYQSNLLHASRDAMHTALSHTRVHYPKNHIVGVYDPVTAKTKVRRGKGIGMGGIWKSLGSDFGGGPQGEEYTELWPEEALWCLERGSLDVQWPPPGTAHALFESEHYESRNVTQKASEHADDTVTGRRSEGLDECERGSQPSPEGTENGHRTGDGIPMSLQAAYAAYLGNPASDLTLPKYLVYASLKRTGYIVRRHAESMKTASPQKPCAQKTRASFQNGEPFTQVEPKSTNDRSPAGTETAGSGSRQTDQRQDPLTSFFARMTSRFTASTISPSTETDANRRARQQHGPLIKPGIYRSWVDVYGLLSLHPTDHQHFPTPDSTIRPFIASPSPHSTHNVDQNSRHNSDKTQPENTPFTQTYNVYKPSQPFRKSRPHETPAAFRICVVDAQETKLPTLPDMVSLLHGTSSPPNSAPGDRSLAGGVGPNAHAHHHYPEQRGSGSTRGKSIPATYAALKKIPMRGQQPSNAAQDEAKNAVVLAIVDRGVTSYLRVNEAGFEEAGALFEGFDARDKAGGMGRGGGGRRGGEGRGRGRGRGGGKG